MSQKVIFRIGKQGQIEVEGEGFKGKTCLEKSNKYIQGLGVQKTQDLKPEYTLGDGAGVSING